MKYIGFLSLLFVLAGMLSACNTTRGVGQDIERTGEAIQRAAS